MRVIQPRRTAGRHDNGEPDSGEVVEQILSATLRLMQDQMFDDISVANIISEAQLSRTTFYFYFASKFTVLRTLLERAVDDIFERVQPFLAQSEGDTPMEALQRSLSSVTVAWHRHRPVLREIAHHWHSDPELHTLWLDVVERFVSSGAEVIDRQREAGQITSTEPSRNLATILFWSTERILYIAGLGIEPMLRDEEAALGLLETLWRGMLYG